MMTTSATGTSIRPAVHRTITSSAQGDQTTPTRFSWLGAARPGFSSGFTLIEVLVVLLIIGVIAGFAVLSISGNNTEDRIKEEAQRLSALIDLASQEAALQSEELGIFFDGSEYTFVKQTNGKWQPLNDSILRKRTLPSLLTLELTTEGEPPPKIKSDEIVPQILILSDGELTPSTITLKSTAGDVAYEVTGTAVGRVTIERQSGNYGR